MKVEIDLNDILGDENGAETLQESVRRQVIENLTSTLNKGIAKRIDVEISRCIDEQIRVAIETQMPAIVNDLLHAEYVMVDRYGHSTGEKTTFRKQLVAGICAEMKYEKRNYETDKNVFTRAIDQVVAENVNAFKSEFKKLVDDKFVAEAMGFAAARLKERLGVKA